MYSTKKETFIWWTFATLCILGDSVSSWNACPVYIPHYCACEITDQAKSTLINMCSYEVKEGIGCKPCPPDRQDYANCTSCPGKTCPVCAPDESDMKALQKSVSLDTYEDIKRIGHIATSFSFMFAQNSSIIPRTDEDQSTSIDNATEEDQIRNEQTISDGNQTTRTLNAMEEDQNRSEQQFSEESHISTSSNAIEIDLNRNGVQFSDENSTTRSSNTTEGNQNSDEQQFLNKNETTRSSNTSEEDQNIKEQQFSDENSTTRSSKTTEENQNSEEQQFLNKNETTRSSNTTEEDQNIKEQQFSGENTTTRSSNATGENQNSDQQQFLNKNETTKSSSTTEEDQIRQEQQLSHENQTSINKNATEGTLKSSELESSEQGVNATDQYSSREDKGEDFNDDEVLERDISEFKNVKVWFSGERPPLEQIMPDEEIFEDNGNKSIGMKENFSFLPDQVFRQPYLQTEMPNEDLNGKNTHFQKDIKSSDARSLLMITEEDNLESTVSQPSVTEVSKYSKDSSVAVTVDGRTLIPTDFTLFSQPGEVYFLRGENLQNDSFSDNYTSFSTGFEDEFQFGSVSSELENNDSRNDESSEITIEVDSKSPSSHLTTRDDQEIFMKNSYLKDVINHDFFDQNNSLIQTLAFDVIFVNYLKYSTQMPDLTTFYFIADYSPEKKVNISLARICFLNQNYFSFSADELNLCRKEMVSIPVSSFLLTVRIQNSHILKEFQYESFDEEEFQAEYAFDEDQHRSENKTLSDGSFLLKNERQRRSSKAYEYNLLRDRAEKFVHDNFNFRKLYTLWETPQNESPDTFRFCHDINLVRVCKNYEDDIRVHVKFEDRFHVIVSAFLDSVTLVDMDVSEIMQMQLYKHKYLMFDTGTKDSKSTGKEDTDQASFSFPETRLSSALYEVKKVGDSKILETIEVGTGENSLNVTEEFEYDSENEQTFISVPYANAEMDTDRNEASESLNLASSLDSIASNFSEETGDTEEMSFTRVNDTTEQEFESNSGNEQTFISDSDANAELDPDRNETSENLNLASSLDSIASNFSEETGDTEEVSFMRVNETTGEEPSVMNGSLTNDIQGTKLELEQDNGGERFRRAANSTEYSPDDWCIYTNQYFNGSVSCDRWSHQKECTIECYPGYDYAGEKSKKFKCKRKENVWVPELIPCLKSIGFTNINVALGLEDNSNENVKSHKEAKDQMLDVSVEVTTGLKDEGHDLLSNYDANDFHFDNYAYDKYNYDSPSDEYE